MRVSYKSTGQVGTYQVTTFGGSLRKIEGYVNASDPVFLQFFDTKLGATTTIKHCVQVLTADGFTFSFEDTEMVFATGCYIALSSTDATYTAIGGGGAASLQVSFEQNLTTGLTIVGDYTTAVKAITVWASGDGYKLVRMEAQNTSGGARYLQIHSVDLAPNGTKPIWTRGLGTAAGIVDYNFGADGMPIDACYIALSSTAETLTLVAASDAKLRASYK